MPKCKFCNRDIPKFKRNRVIAKNAIKCSDGNTVISASSKYSDDFIPHVCECGAITITRFTGIALKDQQETYVYYNTPNYNADEHQINNKFDDFLIAKRQVDANIAKKLRKEYNITQVELWNDALGYSAICTGSYKENGKIHITYKDQVDIKKYFLGKVI